MNNLARDEAKRFAVCPVKCPRLSFKIETLADYLTVISNAVRGTEPFWYRGHSDAAYSLIPSALRFRAYKDRVKALGLMADFKRVAGIKMSRPPGAERELEWSLIAQHYGLPTRLLDWTESATTALYFACFDESSDGLIFVLNPIDLNRLSYAAKPRILDPEEDSAIILAYLKAGAKVSKKGRYPVAINPVWNSDRLMMQKGVFTLHGRRFDLDTAGVPTLVAVPILRESKPQLRFELQRIGVDEMTLFPDLEHSCNHLKRVAGLEKK